METLQHPVVVFWLCMAMHLIADYTLQGCLTDLKTRQWWKIMVDTMEAEHPDWSYEKKHQVRKMYLNDYMAGLICHSLMWSILTFLPLLLITTPGIVTYAIIVNTFTHMVIDHMKANMHIINLRDDQFGHLIQILSTVIVGALYGIR